MSTNQGTTAVASGRQSRSTTQDRRRGRSRSPSAYLRKTGKGLKGLLTGEKRSSRKDISSAKSKSITTSSKKPMSASSSAAVTSSSGTQPKIAASVSKDDSEATKSVNPSNAPSFDDDETVYNVVMDEANKAAVKTAAASVTKALESVKEAVEETAEAAVMEPEPATKEIEKASKAEDSEVSTTNPQDGTVASAAAESEPKLSAEDSLQVILLLMEFKNRRFELLQLEFDPSKALVNDILAQISTAATEEELRNQEYTGICDVGGSEMPADVQLKNFVNGENEVKLAIPAGITAADCAKLAAPILNNAKVRAMVSVLFSSLVSHFCLLLSFLKSLTYTCICVAFWHSLGKRR